MSSAARFLLEFEATGDQEVVSKIKAVGEAGKQTATDLESLRGIEDPFEPIATGADAAVAPIEGVGTAAETAVTPIEGLGTAAEGAVSPLTDMGGATEELGGIFSGAGTEVETFGGTLDAIGTSGEAAAGGLTDANTMVGDFGESAATSGDKTSGFGSDVASVGGAVAALGGSIGTVVSTLFRYNAAQLSVEKANLAAARAAETYRKAEAAIDKILATATSNTDAIAAARARLSAAQTTLNDLVAAGVTSGPQYEAALLAVQDAQAALAEEAAKGGVDVGKLTDAMEKSELSAAKVSTTTKTAAKEQAELNKVVLDSVFGFTSMGGSLVQVASAMGKGKDAAGNLITKMGGLSSSLTTVGLGAVAAYDAFILLNQVMLAAQGFAAQAAGKNEEAAKKFRESWDTAKQSFTIGPGVQEISTALKLLGIDIDSMMGKAVEDGKKLDTTIDKNASTFNQLAVAGSGAGASLKAVAVANQNATQMTDAQTAAVEKLVGSTVAMNGELTGMTSAVAGLTQADADRITTLEESNRAMIVANAGYNNANVAAIQYQQALTAMTQSLVSDTDAKNANAQATLTLVNSEENAQNAIATVNEEYANSVDKLADLNTVLSDSEAHHKAVQTAVNENAAALMEESIELEAAGQSADSLNQQIMRLNNAFNAGVVEIKEWANGLEEAEANQRGQISALEAMGAKFSDIPPFVEKNIETLKLFGVEAKRGGEAAKEAANMAADAWRDATSEMGSEIEGLVDIFFKGGEKVGEATDKWFADLEQKLGRNLTSAERKAAQGLANINAAATQAINNWQFGQLMGESIEKSGADAAAAFDKMGDSFGGKVGEVFHKAAEVIRADPSLANAVNEVMKNVGTTAPHLLLDQLNNILPSGMGAAAVAGANEMSNAVGQGLSGLPSQVGAVGEQAGTAFGTGLTGNAVIDANTMVNNVGLNELPPKAGTIGNESGTVMAQKFGEGWLTVLTAVQGVLDRIPSYIDTVAAKIKPIPLTADVSQAVQKVTEFENVLVSVQAAPIRITADISQAIQVVTEFENTLVSVEASPIIITADSTNAVAAFNRASTSSLTMRNNVTAAANGVKSAVAGAGAAVASFSSKASSSFAKAGAAGTQMANKVKSASSSMKSSLNSAASSAASFASKCVSSFNKVGSSATSNASKVRNLASAISRLKSKTITITTRYVTTGRPGGLQHGGAFIANNPTTIGGTKVGEHYKPELVTVTPLTNPNNLDRTVTVNTPRTGGGGSREVVIPVTLMLDNKVLIRTVRRGLVEEVSGTM